MFLLWSVAIAELPALAWSAPPPCPTSLHVLHALEARLGDAPRSDLALEAEAEAIDGGRWRLRLAPAGGEAGARILEADSCDALAEALVVVAAMALRGAPAARPVLLPPPGPSLAASPPGPATRAQRGPAIPSPRFLVTASGGADFGSLPGPAPLVAIDLALRWEPWALDARLGAKLRLPRTGLAADVPGAGGTLFIAGAVAGLCWRPELGPVGLGACGALEVGRLQGEGFGVRRTGSAGATWWAVAAGPSARYALAPGFHLTATALVTFPLRRPVFVLDGVGEIDAPSAIGLGATTGVEVTIP